jgi:hypothetical protein
VHGDVYVLDTAGVNYDASTQRKKNHASTPNGKIYS